MRWGIVIGMLSALFAVEAGAGSVLIYDGRGKLDNVIRSSPSGFIVYDGRGKIVSAIRQTGLDGRSILDPGRTGIRILGTGLSGEASGLRGGVGFE